ncbi:MarR family winged helix-turn-helix transcriptional regulator [Pseudooceanicola algae]|uniref:Transcriptional regulator SlyA n=1 Tax=Pseudooceanicola algae TaxID=1537215 RepID=A0A418SH85_9RHOB|nr:MarR family transcriptional regulator [Pseudooceanicola algae]QPM90408.1 Transcriptional regulator SlyA [Pseudooceanicola algae]
MTQERDILDAIQLVVRELRRQFDADAQRTGLTLSRSKLLRTLARMEGATQAQLAQELEIEAPSAKRLIDALERDGFVERRGLEGDARKRALFLTERARHERVEGFAAKIRQEALKGLTPEDLTQARDVLDRISCNLTEIRGDDR